MHTAKGCIEEVYLDGRRAARISCPPALIPAPGQYLLATCDSDQQAALAQAVYSAGICPGGFFAAPALPVHWLPGARLNLRGPLGHGFSLPASARQVALVAFGGNGARVLALLEPALAQKAGVVLLADQPPAGLPLALEIQPLAALSETAPWAAYLAIDLRRPQLPALLNLVTPEQNGAYANKKPIPARGIIQLLIETPVPCGGLADCGACAVSLRPSALPRLACKDGPVFDLA
ncbi:MAG: hypothetical protein NTW32_19060 [Chloroflexi bacterium]|nr:hypothetical protein [Chloroflexota bacterium]